MQTGMNVSEEVDNDAKAVCVIHLGGNEEYNEFPYSMETRAPHNMILNYESFVSGSWRTARNLSGQPKRE